MRFIVLFIFFVLTLSSCNNRQDNTHNLKTQTKTSANNFATCFKNIDTSKAGKSISCSGGVYKLINGKYVLHISADFPVQFDSCYNIIIDTSNAKHLTELLSFKNNEANLTNICTDVFVTNIPKPTKQLFAQIGQLIIGFSDPTELYGTKTYRTTILIKNLVFVDSVTGEKTEIKNELIWKVLNLGTPG